MKTHFIRGKIPRMGHQNFLEGVNKQFSSDVIVSHHRPERPLHQGQNSVSFQYAAHKGEQYRFCRSPRTRGTIRHWFCRTLFLVTHAKPLSECPLLQMERTPIKPPVSVKAGQPENVDRVARFVVAIMTCLGALGLAALLFFPLYFTK